MKPIGAKTACSQKKQIQKAVRHRILLDKHIQITDNAM